MFLQVRRHLRVAAFVGRLFLLLARRPREPQILRIRRFRGSISSLQRMSTDYTAEPTSTGLLTAEY